MIVPMVRLTFVCNQVSNCLSNKRLLVFVCELDVAAKFKRPSIYLICVDSSSVHLMYSSSVVNFAISSH